MSKTSDIESINITTDNKTLRQKRTMKYFIDAVTKIINEQGLEHVTIRNVSALAGYNSATLYNYFDDFNHLISFAATKNIMEYMEDLGKQLKDSMTPMTKYLTIWHCFCTHSFSNPELYGILFEQGSHNLSAYIKQYYKLFPEETKLIPEDASHALSETNINSRDRVLLLKCAECGQLSFDAIDDIVEMVHLIYDGFMVKNKEKVPGYDADRFIFYIKRVILSYNPQAFDNEK